MRLLASRILTGVGVAAVVAGLAAWLASQGAAGHEKAVQARQLLDRLDVLSDRLGEAGSCRCAFVSRADRAMGERFAQVAAAVRKELGGLGEQAAAVAMLASRHLDLLEKSVAFRERMRFGDRRQADLSRQAHAAGEALRHPLATLRAQAEAELAGQSERAWSMVRWAGLACVGAVVGVSGAGFATTRRLSARQQRSAAQLAGVKAALDQMAGLQARMEDQFRQSQRLASLGRVTSEVVHDFNNLLGVILNCSEFTLERLPEGDPSRAVLAQAVEAGHRASALTRQVLDVGRSRAEAPAALSLNAAIRAMEPILRRVAGADVEVRLLLDEGLPPVVATAAHLDQVLLNLAANARDAMPCGGSLTLATRLEEGWALLEVADTGCGMDAATLARMFDPFFTTKAEGSGLGMAIIRDAVSRCGGSVEAESEPGRGTRVRVRLPLA